MKHITPAEFVEILKALGILITAVASCIAAWQGHRAGDHAKDAKVEAASARVVADDTNTKVDFLAQSTNGKMDQLIQATSTAAFQAGGDAEKQRASLGSEAIR